MPYKDKETARKEGRRLYALNKEREHILNQERARLLTNKEDFELEKARSRKQQLKSNYGLSGEQYEDMLLIQNNKCAICLKRFIKTPHVDHCHLTGIVRGLLCSLCNTSLGGFEDDCKRLERAAAYIRRFNND